VKSIKAIGCVVASTGLLLPACTGTASRLTPAAQEPAISGTILAVGTTPGKELIEYDLGTRTAEAVDAPTGLARASATGGFAAEPAGPGVANLLLVRASRGAVYRLQLGAAPSRIGSELALPTPSAGVSSAVSGHSALVGSCSGIWVLSIAPGSRWKPVGKSCWATLSPDATSLAVLVGGQAQAMPLGKGHTRPLFDVADASLLAFGTRSGRLIERPSWGSGGMAFGLRYGNQVAIEVLQPSGKLLNVFREQYDNKFRTPVFAWQPGGRLLAILDDMGPNAGVIRLFDPQSTRLWTVALDPIGFSGLIWSPDGRSLATLTSAHALLVMGLNGTWRLRTATNWMNLVAWIS
jgi:hypothetical protein